MRKSNRLKSAFFKQVKTPGTYRDGAGLLLKVEESGSKHWVLRLTVRGKRRDLGLGSAREVTLSEARDLAHEMRKAARLGLDPGASRRAAREGATTFETAAEKVHAQRVKGWGNAKHRDQWITTLRTYALPVIGKMPVSDVAASDVLRVVLPIWITKPETARRVRQRIRTVLDWAVVSGHRSASLANAAIACGPALPRQSRKVKHHPAVRWPDIPGFVVSVRGTSSDEAVRLAIEFLLLTAARTGEVLGATWREIDLDKAIWTVRAARMKSKCEHRVPLTIQALDILHAARARWPRSILVFPGRYGRKPLSNMALLMLMRRLELKAVPHGLRSSFIDWCRDNRKDRDLAEASLSHIVPNKTEAAYARSDLLEARRPMMQEWADYACPMPTQHTDEAAARLVAAGEWRFAIQGKD